MGIALSKRYTSEINPTEMLMTTSQLLLFHYLQQDELKLPTSGAADPFSISSMQITRAIKSRDGELVV